MKRLLWGAAIVLAFAGPAVYLVWQTEWAFIASGIAAFPLGLLILRRAERFDDGGGYVGGPYEPPE